MDVLVELSDRMMPGHIAMPNGMGLEYPDEDGNLKLTGPSPNEITSSALKDEYVGTLWHKTVPARIEPI